MENQLLLKKETQDSLSSSVKFGLAKMTPQQQHAFEEDYLRKRKGIALPYIFMILLPIHYFYVGKTGLNILFLLSGGGFFIWWLIDLFRIPSIIGNYNTDLANDIFRDQKIMNG